MDQLLFKYPRWMIVGGALVLGLILILLFNPPYSKCDSQFELFQSSQTPFLYKDNTKKFNDKTNYEILSDICRTEGMPGSCLRFFEGLRGMISNLEAVPSECIAEIAGKSEIKSAVITSLDIMYKLAWGDKTPESAYDRAGWFDTVQLNLFCDLNSVLRVYPEGDAVNLREKVLNDLSQKSGLNRKEVWNRSLFTMKCI